LLSSRISSPTYIYPKLKPQTSSASGEWIEMLRKYCRDLISPTTTISSFESLFVCPCLSVTVLKRVCSNVGLGRWPARAISKQTSKQVKIHPIINWLD
jgi:hypothetical protein